MCRAHHVSVDEGSPSLRFAFVGLALGAVACGSGSGPSAPDAGAAATDAMAAPDVMDAGTVLDDATSDVGQAQSTDGSNGTDAPEASADASTDGADSAVDAGDALPPPDAAADGQGSTCDAGAPVASRQTVSLVVTNQTTADRFVIDSGWGCDAYSFAAPGDAPLPLGIGFQCMCECPAPGGPGPLAVHRVAPGASVTLTWNALSIVTCDVTVDCSSQGWPGTPPMTEVSTTPVLALPGTYVATVTAFKSLPMNCSGSGPSIPCSMGPGPGLSVFGMVQQICTADVTASATFTLPASGDVQVPLAITQ